MTTLSNDNFLSPVKFRFVLERTPTVTYFCQAVTLPTMTMGELIQATPMYNVPRHGDKLQYDSFSLRFRVDEDLVNYEEIRNWMIALGAPETPLQFKRMIDQSNRTGHAGAYSDGTLIIETSNANVNKKIVFEDMFPISLSPLNFDITQPSIEYLECEVSFRYKIFNIQR